MALGEALGEFLAEVFVQVVHEGIVKTLVVPILRFPGAVIGWSIGRGSSFRAVWAKGDGFQQGMVDVLFYVLAGLSWVYLFQG